MTSLLLIEDDTVIADSIAQALKQAGWQVDCFGDAVSGDGAMQVKEYALVLLDLGLPKGDGMSLLQTWRGQGNTTPVLILTARDAIANRVAGLNAGADDYLVKPFALDELLARVQALLRRSQGQGQSLLSHGEVSYDPIAQQVYHQGTPVDLTAKELLLVGILLANPKRWFSRAMLEDQLYGWEQEVESNAIEVHIHHLRKKLGQQWIKTKRGVGYGLMG